MDARDMREVVLFDGVGLGPVRYRSEFRCSSCVFQVQFVVFW